MSKTTKADYLLDTKAEMTDYPMHPTYLVKVEGLHNQQKALPRRVTIASVDSRVSQQSRNVETHTHQIAKTQR